MAANGISTLPSKQLKQEGKLSIAEAKRQGYTVLIDGTWSGNANVSQPFYRTLNTANINILPTKYVSNVAVDNVVDGNVLILGRPWE